MEPFGSPKVEKERNATRGVRPSRRAAAALTFAMVASVAASGRSWIAVSATSTVPERRATSIVSPNITPSGSMAIVTPSSATE